MAVRAVAKLRQVLEIKVNIVGDVKVEVAIVIVVAEPRTGSPTAFVAYAGFLGDVGESSIAAIALQRAAIKISDVNVFPAVVVVIADSNTKSPAAGVKPGLCGHVFESPVMIVAIEFAGVTLAGLHIIES